MTTRHEPTERELDVYWRLRNTGQYPMADALRQAWDRGESPIDELDCSDLTEEAKASIRAMRELAETIR